MNAVKGLGYEREAMDAPRTREEMRRMSPPEIDPSSARQSRPNPDLIVLHGLSKAFGGVYALKDINLAFEAGRVHGLVGENGAGKSTLIKTLSGWITDYEGEITIRGQRVAFNRPADSEAHGVATVYQELSNVDALSVAENVFLGNLPATRSGRVKWNEVKQAARRRLDYLGLSDVRVDDPLYLYPIGVKQLVEVARALEKGAEIVILDEPTSALSEEESDTLLGIVDALRGQGMTVLFISQKLNQVFSVADTVSVLRDGALVLTGPKKDLEPAAIIKAMLGKQLQSVHGGENPCADLPAGPGRDRPPLLELQHVTMRRKLHDVSLAAYPAESLVLYGLMGAGHVEVGRVLYGLERAESGTILLEGEPLNGLDPMSAKAHGIAYVAEDRKTSTHLTFPLYANLSLPYLRRVQRSGAGSARANEMAVAEHMTETLAIKTSNVAALLASLSGGNQQKAAIARWLTTDSVRLLVLQEPTRGVDVGAKADILEILRRLKSDGLSLILITHEPETAVELADRIIVFAKGRIATELSGQRVCKSNLLEVES